MGPLGASAGSSRDLPSEGETMVACSTPPGTSGLAVIRLSGPACREVAADCLGRRAPIPRHVYHGAFRAAYADPARPGFGSGEAATMASGPGSAANPPESQPGSAAPIRAEVLDRLNYVFFPGPASATGEDVLELYPHGNPLLIDRILRVLLARPGVRLAGPGEYTRRAFENGKIDLLQAEAVGQLLHAETVQALRNARRMAEGVLSAPLKALRDGLVELSARLELDVDFSEEEADPDYAGWIPRLRAIRLDLELLAEGFERGRALGRAPRVAILGAANAGKSSLVNALARQDRLMVSEMPGTTRDWVEVTLMVPAGRIQLVDTAGLGTPVDALDAQAMERTRRQWEEADVRVWVEDGTDGGPRPLTGADRHPIDLRVSTRSDLKGFRPVEDALPVSNLSGAGLDALRARLEKLAFRDRGTGAGEDVVLATERQFRAVLAARERVDAALEALRRKPAIEILAFEIREAAGHLRELLGEIAPDEILARIFSGYCIGK